MLLQSAQYTQALKLKLHERRLHIEQLIENKYFELNAENELFYASMLTGPFIKLELEAIVSLLQVPRLLQVTDSAALVEPALSELVRLRTILAESQKEEPTAWRRKWQAAKTVVLQFAEIATKQDIEEALHGYWREPRR